MKKLIAVFCMMLLSTPAFALSTKPSKPDFNPKYQFSVQQTCKLDGHPNFVLDANGQKIPNPLVQGYKKVWYQGYLFKSGICDYKNDGSPVDPWVDGASPYCFDPQKIEYYSCTFNE